MEKKKYFGDGCQFCNAQCLGKNTVPFLKNCCSPDATNKDNDNCNEDNCPLLNKGIKEFAEGVVEYIEDNINEDEAIENGEETYNEETGEVTIMKPTIALSPEDHAQFLGTTMRRSALDNIVLQEPASSAPRILVHGTHKIGKTSWAIISPKPIFIITETGLTGMKVPHFPLAETTDNVFNYMSLLMAEDHQYQTLIVDTIDWLEKLFWTSVCIDNNQDSTKKKVKYIEDIDFSRGYKLSLHYHEKMIAGLKKLWQEKNMAIILLCHNEVKTYNNPHGDNYDQHILKLHKAAAKAYEEFVDSIFFINYKEYVNTGQGIEKNKAVGTGERAIFTQPRPAYSAGTRYNLPEEIPYRKGEGFLDLLKLINAGKGK